MRTGRRRPLIAALLATALGAACTYPLGFKVIISSAQAQTAARGLETRPALDPLNLPFDGESSSTELEMVSAFPKLSFSRPLYIAAAPGTDSHLYVVQQAGVIRRFANSTNTTSSATFLDLSTRVRFSDSGEDGLLGLAFHPDYAANGHFYVYYSPKDDPRRTVVSRFRRSTGNPAIADPASEEILLTVPQFGVTHRGGCLQFGPDGKLYLATGDGGGSTSGPARAQDLASLSGKVLRLNANGSIPSDNPFVGVSGVRQEIWARGLRNPWRFSFDRGAGGLWLADVGQDSAEEVNLIRKGGNYGWGFYEGNQVFQNPNNLPASNFDFPVYTYPHSSADPDAVAGESITGGYVYRGSQIPQLAGRYVFADFIAGRIWALDHNNGSVTGVQRLPDVSLPASFGEDNAGNLYVVSLIPGEIYKLRIAGGGGSQIPARLSDTGLFNSTASLTPNPGLIEYSINAPFWSEGTRKRRWIGLANGSGIGFSSTAAWSWPARAVVVKHFEITLATGVEHRLETRVFVNTVNGWRGYTYRWNSAQTDADLLPDARSSVQLQVLDESSPTGISTQTYVFPSRSDCQQCHTAAAGTILGPRTAQMNRSFTYPNGVTDNQLRAFNDVALFTTDIGSPMQYAALTDPANTSASLANRARAYLETNCSQCHRPGGPTPVNLDLRATTSNASTNTLDKRPSGNDLGIDDAFIIAAGDKERSVLWQRMRSLDETVRMPPLGSRRVDTAGVALIGEWIDSLAVAVPSVAFTSTSRTVSENVGSLSLSLQLSAATTRQVTVPITVEGSAISGADYTLSTSAITIEAGSTRASGSLTILNDALDEPTETVVISMGAPVNATLGATLRHTVSIEDKDNPPTVRFAAAISSAQESASSVNVRVDLSAPSGREISVPIAFGGSARAPLDYAPPPATLIIPAGLQSANLRFNLANDALDEPTETILVMLGEPTHATLGSLTQHSLSIGDDDVAPTLSLVPVASGIDESAGGIEVEAELSNPSGYDLVVPLSFGGSAVEVLDYERAVTDLRIPAGTRTASLQLQVVDDTLDEAPETLRIGIGIPANVRAGTLTQLDLRIEDNDAPPIANFTAATRTQMESAGPAVVRVGLSTVSGQDISLPLIWGGSARPSQDYAASPTSLKIPAGALGASLSVGVIDDVLNEGLETVIVGLGSSAQATTGSVPNFTLRIRDDDPLPRLSFALAQRTVRESGGLQRIRVQLSASSGRDVEVPIRIGGSALQSVDYRVEGPAVVRVPAGRQFADLRLSLIDDTEPETLETIVLMLGRPTHAETGGITDHRLRIRASD